jgi:hypothetical protein
MRQKILIVLLGTIGLVLMLAGPAYSQAGLTPLARACEEIPSQHEIHNGFQAGPRCAETEFGEVSAAAQNPSLLIAEAPAKVKTGESFRLNISTRNLVRDRFLPAGQGGYYLETSILNGQGLQRGHFHVACRYLGNLNAAPAPDLEPVFFKAVEDGKGGAAPDSVAVDVPGSAATKRGTLQCSAWAGDGSHRTPMMERARQTPAFDSVRIDVNGDKR